MGWLILLVLLLIVLILLLSCVKIVPQATAMVVERLGGYRATWSVGLHVKAPFIDRVAKKVILKEQVVDFAPQPVITRKYVVDYFSFHTKCRKLERVVFNLADMFIFLGGFLVIFWNMLRKS